LKECGQRVAVAMFGQLVALTSRRDIGLLGTIERM